MPVSLTARAVFWAGLVLALCLGATYVVRSIDAAGYRRAKSEMQVEAERLAQQNRELQRAAELRYTVQAETRERFITNTVKEIRYVTPHLAACPVGEPGVRLLNAAAACARGDPAACSGDPGLRLPR